MATDDKPVKITQVAVGVLQKPDGSVLYAQRPAGKVYEGWWEFPGGKREHGEPIEQTLVRELQEELGITVTQFAPWVIRDHVYPHASVRLHFFRVTQWLGDPASREAQVLRWQDPAIAAPQPLLPAAIPVIDWLSLPGRYVYTGANLLGIGEAANAVKNQIKKGACLVQLFEPSLSDHDLIALYKRLSSELEGATNSRLVMHQVHQHVLTKSIDQTDIRMHLDSTSLMACLSRPAAALVGADCETLDHQAHATALGLDFIVMPEDFFLQAARTSHLPVFVLPKPATGPLPDFLSIGAHGVCIR